MFTMNLMECRTFILVKRNKNMDIITAFKLLSWLVPMTETSPLKVNLVDPWHKYQYLNQNLYFNQIPIRIRKFLHTLKSEKHCSKGHGQRTFKKADFCFNRKNFLIWRQTEDGMECLKG